MSSPGRISERERTIQLGIATLTFFIGFAGVALFNISVKNISAILHLSILQKGILVAIPTLSGSFLRIPFSVLVDRIGGKRVLMIQLAITLLGLLGLFMIFYLRVITFEILLVLGIIAGTGISTFSPGITFVSYWYPKARQGTALGVYGGLGNTAPGIFTVIIPFLISAVGLGFTYLIWAALVLAVLIVLRAFAMDNYYQQFLRKGYDKDTAMRMAINMGQEIFPATDLMTAIRNAIKKLETHLLTIMYFTSFGGFIALTSWLPTYWTSFYNVDQKLAALLTGVIFSLVTALMRVPGGFLSDKYGGERISIYSYFMIIIGSVVIMSSTSVSSSIIGEVIMAVGMGVANAAVFKLVPKYVKEAVAGASGWVGGIGAAGGLVIPPIMALIVQFTGRLGYQLGFIIFVILGIISITIGYYLMKTSSEK